MSVRNFFFFLASSRDEVLVDVKEDVAYVMCKDLMRIIRGREKGMVLKMNVRLDDRLHWPSSRIA